MGKNGLLLSKMPANELAGHLENASAHLRDQALRYFLEYQDKGRENALARRKSKIAAKWVLAAVDSVHRVDKEDRDLAIRHIRDTLFKYAQERGRA
ncbi:MAG: hypothetical protein ACREGR_05065 [Minisyncoccia bacterium]